MHRGPGQIERSRRTSRSTIITSWLSPPGDFNGTALGPGNFHDGGGYKLAESYVYWLNGAIPLAATLEDEALMGQIRTQLTLIFDRSDAIGGWLGPLTPDSAYPNPWSTVWTCPGRLSGLSILHSKSVLYGVFVWAA